MTKAVNVKGNVYRCPICGAEIIVIAKSHGCFTPHCCNVDMVLLQKKVIFFVCPVCGTEIVSLKRPNKSFKPRCCNTDMVLSIA